MLEKGLEQQLGENKEQESKQFSFRRIYAGENRELLNESSLIRATVKSPIDMRRLNLTKGNI